MTHTCQSEVHKHIDANYKLRTILEVHSSQLLCEEYVHNLDVYILLAVSEGLNGMGSPEIGVKQKITQNGRETNSVQRSNPKLA